jgi:hypothetical protein
MLNRVAGRAAGLASGAPFGHRRRLNQPGYPLKICLTAIALLTAAVDARAAPTAYAIDPAHTARARRAAMRPTVPRLAWMQGNLEAVRIRANQAQPLLRSGGVDGL